VTIGAAQPITGLIADRAAWEAEQHLCQALCRGEEAAFLALVELYQRAMLRVARLYVASDAAAEDVVQETWVAVLRGLPRFEGRSSLKTWIFHILTNRAQTQGKRDARSLPFAALHAHNETYEPAVAADRFREDGEWASAPMSWEDLPEERLLAAETRTLVEGAIAGLPANQRTVITLRDVEGWSAEEVCALLQISDANQRVLLHRARSRVRAALEQYLATP
jgi:RNA polymerase sigma-70 factor (ECF subfamily)